MTGLIPLFQAGSDAMEQWLSHYLTRSQQGNADIMNTVREIIARIRHEGDAALCELTERFDRVRYTPDALRIPAEEIANASVAPEVEEALKLAATRIQRYHEAMMPQDLRYHDDEGILLGARWTAVDSVGLYVPGGTAAYPSSVLMNAIPAKVAGVRRIAMVVPSPDGVLNPAVLVAARISGVEEIYRIGGAQAVAAFAYGTDTIPPVKVVVGPGNAYVAEAKRQLFGIIGIDTIAGPSEVLVVADSQNDPDWIAADMMSQAEHDVMASSILVVEEETYANQVIKAMESQLKTLPRAEMIRRSLADNGAIIVVADIMRDAPPLIDRLAPEHLELAVTEPQHLMKNITHAGAVFLGRYTPEALGDYVLGPSHVLPTSGAAAYASGLSVYDFLKRSSFMQCERKHLATVGRAAALIAEAEGLQAHALSVTVRGTKE